MATMYAKSTLTTWYGGPAGFTGWSNASGGVDNGLTPDGTTDVIFDANSGPARTIVLDASTYSVQPACNSITTTGSNSMVLASDNLNVTTSVNITWTSSGSNIGIQFVTAGNKTFSAPNFLFSSLYNVDTSAKTITLTGNLQVLGGLGGITNTTSTFDAAGFNITTPSLSATGGSLKLGSGTLTLTGTGTVFDLGSTTTFVAGTSTIKVTDTSATAKGCGSQAGTRVYNNFWVTGKNFTLPFSSTFNDIKLGPGADVKFGSASTTTVTTLTADGTGSPITIASAGGPGNSATLAKSGGGRINVDYCSIRDITASPAATFFARNSVNVSNNTGWTFLPGNSAFLQFF